VGAAVGAGGASVGAGLLVGCSTGATVGGMRAAVGRMMTPGVPSGPDRPID